jgi:hypothetical protein
LSTTQGTQTASTTKTTVNAVEVSNCCVFRLPHQTRKCAMLCGKMRIFLTSQQLVLIVIDGLQVVKPSLRLVMWIPISKFNGNLFGIYV